MKTFKDIKHETEILLNDIGTRQSEKLFKRIESLVKEIKKKYPITEIIVGTGGFSIKHDSILMFSRDDPTDVWYSIGGSDLNSWLMSDDLFNNRLFYQPIDLTRGDIERFDELKSILEYLSTDRLNIKDSKVLQYKKMGLARRTNKEGFFESL